MLDFDIHSHCIEYSVVEKTIIIYTEIYGENRHVKIEALHDLKNNNYFTRGYYEKTFTLQPSENYENGKYLDKAESYKTWVTFDDLPWTNRQTADEAIKQALSLLFIHRKPK